MYRAIPEVNRAIASKQLTEAKKLLRARLRDIKEGRSKIDNTLPSAMQHPIVKLKKEQMIEGKQKHR